MQKKTHSVKNLAVAAMTFIEPSGQHVTIPSGQTAPVDLSGYRENKREFIAHLIARSLIELEPLAGGDDGGPVTLGAEGAVIAAVEYARLQDELGDAMRRNADLGAELAKSREAQQMGVDAMAELKTQAEADQAELARLRDRVKTLEVAVAEAKQGAEADKDGKTSKTTAKTSKDAAQQ